MITLGFEMQAVRGKEQIPFSCSRCAKCCRHVKESIVLESLDAYRIAGFLNAGGKRYTGWRMSFTNTQSF